MMKRGSTHLDLRMVRCHTIPHQPIRRRQTLVHVDLDVGAQLTGRGEELEDTRRGIEARWAGADDCDFERGGGGGGVGARHHRRPYRWGGQRAQASPWQETQHCDYVEYWVELS